MRARMWEYDTSLVAPVTAATQRHTTRTHLFLEIEVDGVYGYGEIVPQPRSINGDPAIVDVVDEFEQFTLRNFADAARREGAAPHWARVTHFAGSRAASRPANALLEMALLDLELRAHRRTITDQWPARFTTPPQVTISLLDEGAWSDHRGAAQVRAKISSREVPVHQWQRLANLHLPVLLDFNCAATSIENVVRRVAGAQEFVDVVALEQPFAPGNVVEHARLAERLNCPVSLDEGVRHRRDLDQIARYRAARMVCIKPARVGGYAQARTMIELAQSLGLGVYVGGFFESPLARGVNRSLADHYPVLPSDVADPALRPAGLLDVDPWGFGRRPSEQITARTPRVSQQW